MCECHVVDTLGDDFEDGETLEEVFCQLSVQQAISGPDAPGWIGAISKEKTKLQRK